MFPSTVPLARSFVQMATYLIVSKHPTFPDDTTSTYIIPPWKRDNWNPAISRMEMFRVHRALEHPESSTMSTLLRKSLGEAPMTPEMKREFEAIRCSECAATPELPRKPKLALPPEATPNVVVSLDVMPHKIRNKPVDI